MANLAESSRAPRPSPPRAAHIARQIRAVVCDQLGSPGAEHTVLQMDYSTRGVD